MGADYDSLEYWRRFFRTAPAAADIFEVVERAIAVAAADSSDELRRRRDRIAELLFTATLRFPASSPGEPTPNPISEVDEEEGGKEEEEGDGSVRENAADIDDNRIVSNYSFDEAAALTEEIEERSQYVGEVFRIKDILLNKENESDGVLLDCLRRLQLMTLSYDTLSATAIGKAVNGLRKHSSKQIRNLVRTLIDGWKVAVDEWVKNTSVITEKSPDSVNPSSTLDEEEGLPSPPMDEGAFLATHANIQLSGFFEGMDDDGNPRTSMESDHHWRNRRGNNSTVNKQQNLDCSSFHADDGQNRNMQQIEVNQQIRKQDQVHRQATRQEVMRGEVKHQSMSNQKEPANMGPSRPPRPVSELKQSLTASQRKLLAARSDKTKHSSDDFEDDLQARLEVAKRKLHVGYQVADNAKKQRTIQVVEPHDLPKQPNHHRLPNMKPKTNNLRNRLIGRR